MTVTPPDTDPLHDALVTFTGCVGSALTDICSYSLTIGEAYVPFDPDPDTNCPADDAVCSQAWVRVMGVQAIYKEDSFGGEDCASALQLSLEVGVLRCFDIPEGGEAANETEVLAAALQSMDDMKAIYCAAMNCEVWEQINSGTWTPSGPMGGQYGGIWTFDVEL